MISGYSAHIFSLLEKQEILWKCILNDGTQVWSDFDVPDQKDPWTRLKNYCNNNNKDIVEVKVICPGMPETSIYKDEKGLDNFLITRGIIRDLNDADDGMVFRFMCFGKLNDQGSIDVTKFYWPEFELKEGSEVRQMTPENDALLYKRRETCGDNCTCQSNEQN